MTSPNHSGTPDHLAHYETNEVLLRMHLRNSHDADLPSGIDAREHDVEAHFKVHRPTTPRGFRMFGKFVGDQAFTASVKVIESSTAGRGPCVWIHEGRRGNLEPQSVHLDLEGAKRVRDALELFIAEAERGDLTETVLSESEGSLHE